MDINEYRKWRPTWSAYERNYPQDSYDHERINQFLACTGLAAEAAELMAVVHKAYRKDAPIDLAKAKDEASDVWWYLNKILDDFGWTLEELSEYNKKKLDDRNNPA